jgi:DUF4097 and DUF4098 domain-containing protein YvlB
MTRTSTKSLIAVLTAAVLLATGASLSFAERIETYDLKPGKKIVVELEDGGSIQVVGWNKSEAEITFSDQWRDLDDYETDIEETKYGLKISAELVAGENSNTSLLVSLKVPRQVDIEFSTMGGCIQLEDIEGTFTGKTMGGNISIEDLKGDIEIKTMGGEIKVLDSELDGKIHTMGGPVLVKDVVGDIRASSNGGNVRYINVRRKSGRVSGPRRIDREDADVTGKTVQISSMGGSIDVDEAPDGAVVFTAGGEIDIKDADKFVEAQTGGGDISIEFGSGRVEASTGAGDIDVDIKSDTKEDGDVTLVTGTGDVTLTVPPGFSMELDIDLGYTRNSDRDYRIISDFEFDEERTQEWDREYGSPQKHIYGTGIIAGGRHLIRIRTVNGDVRIKKGK